VGQEAASAQRCLGRGQQQEQQQAQRRLHHVPLQWLMCHMLRPLQQAEAGVCRPPHSLPLGQGQQQQQQQKQQQQQSSRALPLP
jgi:hypothetical protein